LQNSGVIAYYASRAYLTNPKIVTEYGEIGEGTLSLIVDRAVSDGIHEDFDIRNYGTRYVSFSLELSLRTDFADIFEVKSKRLVLGSLPNERAQLTHDERFQDHPERGLVGGPA
jgi:N-terminal domain of (some) glycogen debranching enzymes